jgi:hypothetical protein
MTNGIQGTANQKYREELKETGIWDKPNPLLNIDNPDPCPDFIEEQEKNDDRWDPKNWGV